VAKSIDKMKILIFTNHFYPENFRVNDIAFHLASDGHDVTVLTAIPDYPKGRFYDGYNVFRKRVEKVNGVKIIRCLIIPRGKGGMVRLLLNYLSYTISSILMSIFIGLFRKYDVVFVHETSPIMIGIPAVIIKKMQNIPLYFWVLDLWPESLSAAGGIKNKYVLSLFENLTKWIYENSYKILIGSRGFKSSICSKGDFKDKLVYFPNWGEDVYLNKNLVEIPYLPDGFKVMFAGNIGEAQNFEKVMAVAQELRNTEVKWILLGEGRKKPWIEKYIKDNNLSNSVFLMGSFPVNMMPSFFSKADAMFLSLKDNDIFKLTIPAKIQAYMASARPILAMIDGETKSVIEDAKCGFVVGPDECKLLCEIIKTKVLVNKEEFNALGLNGYNYYMKYFDKKKCMDSLDSIMFNV
jgi:glycosyltransferase involved in cell wall biosynthesis